MKSIEYAENKLSAKMGEPQKLEKAHPNAPVKYDVEEVDTKISSSNLAGVTSKATEDSGDCDIDDTSCIADQQRVMKEALKLMASQSKQREDDKKAAAQPKEQKKDEPKPTETKKEEAKPAALVENKKEEPKPSVAENKPSEDQQKKDAAKAE